ncbi:MAG: metalloregulator ArsR/SmtB family transcription factor, partial [Actinomycetota bacterium]
MKVTLTAEDTCSPVASHAIGQDAASSVAATLKALSDPLRLRMLSAIASNPRGESCVCDLAELAEVSQPTVSHHLKVLKDVDVLTSERRGTWVWYKIHPNRRRAVTTLLDSFAPATVAGPASDGASEESLRPDFDARVTRLADELFADIPEVDEAVVLTVVRESYTALARTARVTSALIPLAERFARQRLSDLTRDRDTAVPQVLFVCVANAGRSQ